MEVADGSPTSGSAAAAATAADQQQSLQQQQQQPLSGRVSGSVSVASSAAAGATLAAGSTGSVAGAAADSAAGRAAAGSQRGPVVLGRELLPDSWCDEVAERLLWAIVTAASGDDAKAKAAALLKEHAMQLAHAQQDEPSQAELAKEAESKRRGKGEDVDLLPLLSPVVSRFCLLSVSIVCLCPSLVWPSAYVVSFCLSLPLLLFLASVVSSCLSRMSVFVCLSCVFCFSLSPPVSLQCTAVRFSPFLRIPPHFSLCGRVNVLMAVSVSLAFDD